MAKTPCKDQLSLQTYLLVMAHCEACKYIFHDAPELSIFRNHCLGQRRRGDLKMFSLLEETVNAPRGGRKINR